MRTIQWRPSRNGARMLSVVWTELYINKLNVCVWIISRFMHLIVMTEGFYIIWDSHGCFNVSRMLRHNQIHTCASVYVHTCTWTLCRFSTVTTHTHTHKWHWLKENVDTNVSLSLFKPRIISSGKVKVDLIFCLVFIKQLLHYFILHN